jgi:hypothetical protein
MVHALGEIHRTLSPSGVLIDLRPLANGAPVEIVSARETLTAGRFEQTPQDIRLDEAADAALAEAGSLERFSHEREARFPFNYYFDSPSELEDWAREDWGEDAATLSEEARARMRAAWAVADGDARLRLSMPMFIARWRRLPA